jgi:hypothetical protein
MFKIPATILTVILLSGSVLATSTTAPVKDITPAVAPLKASAYETSANPEQPKPTPLKPTAPAPQKNPIDLSKKRDKNGNPYPSIEAYIADTYVLAKDSDFIGDIDGQFQYVGDAEYVIVPEVIKGVRITSTACMFKGSTVKGVICDNPNITDMRAMFWDARTNEIEFIQNKPRSALELMLNTSNVTDMSWMFNGAVVEELILTSFDTSKVEDFSAMFQGSRAKTIDVSTFDTSSGVYFTQMFDNTFAEDINLRHFDVSNAKNLNNMFSRSKFKNLDLRHFDTSKTEFMSNMFADCEATSIDISRFNFSNVSDISGMFAGAKNLLSVDFSNLLVTGGNRFQEHSLTYGSNIKTIYINSKQDPETFRTYCHPDTGTALVVK